MSYHYIKLLWSSWRLCIHAPLIQYRNPLWYL